MQEIIVLSDRLDESMRRVLKAQPEAPVLLLGESLFADLDSFDGRKLFCLDSEAAELGLSERLEDKVEQWRPSEIIDLLCANRVLNL